MRLLRILGVGLLVALASGCAHQISFEDIAYSPGRSVLLEKSYTESGPTQGAKMFWAGALGMNSAIRQSSFEAY